MKIDPHAILRNQRAQMYSRDKARMSEVARIANQLQQQGMTRTEALRAAERMVPH